MHTELVCNGRRFTPFPFSLSPQLTSFLLRSIERDLVFVMAIRGGALSAYFFLPLLAFVARESLANPNGLGALPPMGWNTVRKT
jgi:hypothetical protein